MVLGTEGHATDCCKCQAHWLRLESLTRHNYKMHVFHMIIIGHVAEVIYVNFAIFARRAVSNI